VAAISQSSSNTHQNSAENFAKNTFSVVKSFCVASHAN